MHVITDLKITLFKGVVIRTCQGTVEAKGLLLLGTNDLQSKAYILNMNHHNGACGCSTCLEEGRMWHKERDTLAIVHTTKQLWKEQMKVSVRMDRKLSMEEKWSMVSEENVPSAP